MRKNAPTDVSVSKSFPEVIPPDPRYRERATPSRTLPQHGLRRVPGRILPGIWTKLIKTPGCWDFRASRSPLEYGLATGL